MRKDKGLLYYFLTIKIDGSDEKPVTIATTRPRDLLGDPQSVITRMMIDIPNLKGKKCYSTHM